MADFDDLLPPASKNTSSTLPFLDNPFEDPFADVGGRPRSPDPWSSGGWGQPEPELNPYASSTANAFSSDSDGFYGHTDSSAALTGGFTGGFGETSPTRGLGFRRDEPPSPTAAFHQYTQPETPESPTIPVFETHSSNGAYQPQYPSAHPPVEESKAPPASSDPLGSDLVEPEPQPVKRNPFGPLPPAPKLEDLAPTPKPDLVFQPSKPKPKPVPVEPSEDKETPKDAPTSSSNQPTASPLDATPKPADPLETPLPSTPSPPDAPQPGPAPAATPLVPPHAPSSPTSSSSSVVSAPNQSSPMSTSASRSGFSNNSNDHPSNKSSDLTPVIKYDRIVSPLDTPTIGTRSPFDHSFTSLSLGGEAPGWGGSVEYQPPSKSSDASHNGADHSPSHSVATVTNDEALDGQVDEAEVDKPPEKDHTIAPQFTITVGDPQKVGDPISAHIIYTVHTRTASPLFSKPSFSVLRRYSDFLWLVSILAQNNPGVIVPPAPEKNALGRFQDQFVESRRLALNKCIQKIANHPILSKDEDFKFFLESDSFAVEVRHRRPDIAPAQGGLIASLGAIAGPKFYEVDDWFDNKRAYLDALEAQLRSLIKAIDLVSKQRAEFAVSISEFSDTIRALSNSDLSKQLSSALSVLADVEKLHKENQDTQAKDDVVTLMGTADEYTRLVNSVRLAFNSRIKLYFNWQSADSDVRRVKAAYEKARRQGKMSMNLAELNETERRANEARKEFDECSKLIKMELGRFEYERIEDFKNVLELFLDGMIRKQRSVIKAWEDYQELLLQKAASNATAKSSPAAANAPAIMTEAPTPTSPNGSQVAYI